MFFIISLSFCWMSTPLRLAFLDVNAFSKGLVPRTLLEVDSLASLLKGHVENLVGGDEGLETIILFAFMDLPPLSFGGQGILAHLRKL